MSKTVMMYDVWCRVIHNPDSPKGIRLQPHQWYSKCVSTDGWDKNDGTWPDECYGVITLNSASSRVPELDAGKLDHLPDGCRLNPSRQFLFFPRWKEKEVAELFGIQIADPPWK
jgi:hypothetical protein